MAHVTTRSIIIKDHNPCRKEVQASEIISPGHLLERTATAGDVKKNDAVEGNATVMVALEDELQGKGISDNYADNAKIQAAFFQRGDEFIGRLANGQNAAIGDKLAPAADGEVAAYLPDSSGIVVENRAMFVALEAVDMSGSTGADPSGLIKLEVL